MNDRRNELQQNELAQSLGRLNTAIEPYSKIIALAAAVVIVGIVGFALLKSEEAADRSRSTFNLISSASSGDAELIEQIYEATPDSLAGGWAAIFAADALLASGINDLFTDRETGLEQIDNAIEAYQNASRVQGDSLLTSRARLGIAKATEAKGDIDGAIEGYKELVPVAESDAVREFAEDRIAVLQRGDTKRFTEWFEDQDFSPAQPSLPPALPGAGAISSEPDLSLPDLDFGLDMESSDDSDAVELPMTETPSEGSATESSEESTTESTEAPGEESAATSESGKPEKDAAEAEPSTSEPETAVPPAEESADPPADPPADTEASGGGEKSGSDG